MGIEDCNGFPGASPHNLLAGTLGDELKLATQGKARVFGIALKDRAAVLPAGFAGRWGLLDRPQIRRLDHLHLLPQRSAQVGAGLQRRQAGREISEPRVEGQRTAGYCGPLNLQEAKNPVSTKWWVQLPFANDYELEFARELVTNEHLGNGPATDLLVISLSANDILGHKVGPDSPEMRAMVLATDRQLAAFFDFLGHEVGLANTWIALSADHGIAPLVSTATALRIPAASFPAEKLRVQVNQLLSAKLQHPAEYVRVMDYPDAWLNEEAFASIKLKEEDAERAVGEALKQAGLRGYFTRSDLRDGEVPNTETGLQYLHSYSPVGGWYVMGIPAPYSLGSCRRYGSRVALHLRHSRSSCALWHSRFSRAPIELMPNRSIWLSLWLPCSASTPRVKRWAACSSRL